MSEGTHWVEKYRPKSLDDVVGHERIISTLKKYVDKNAIPHIIFNGPAGCGKNSTAYGLIHDIFKDNMIGNPLQSSSGVVLEMNASEEMRMENLPEVKQFVFSRNIQQNDFYKFLIMDEADNMSRDVQTAFRRIIELAPNNVKFIFTCNYIEKIIDPIVSRCAIFRLPPLRRDQSINRIHSIVKKEDFKITDEAIEELYNVTKGDLRSAINALQTLSLVTSKKLTDDVVCDFFGILPRKQLNKFMDGVMNVNLDKIIGAFNSVTELYPRYFLMQLLRKTDNMDLSIEKRSRIWKIIATSDYQITEKANERMQMNGIAGKLVHIFRS